MRNEERYLFDEGTKEVSSYKWWQGEAATISREILA